jgi:AraC-like DNA-binding protein
MIQAMPEQPVHEFYTPIDLPDDFAIATERWIVLDDRPIVSLEYHDVLEIGLCHEGAGVFVVGQKIEPFGAGDVSIISPHEPHLARSRRGTRSTWSFVFADIDALLLPRFPELRDYDIHAFSGPDFHNIRSAGSHPALSQIISTIIREARDPRAQSRTMILAGLAMMAATLERDFSSSSTRTAAQAVHTSLSCVRRALGYIARHYYEPMEVADLAALCNMSPRNFSRRFTEALKRPPHGYIRETRVAMACSDLLRTDAPISVIAEQSGFFSVSAFNRAFVTYTGLTPREWRKQHGE